MAEKYLKYFSKSTVQKILRIIAIVLIAAGILIVCFAYGFGPYGVPVILIGIVLFFISDAIKIKDSSYDEYMKELLPAAEEDKSALTPDLSSVFVCYADGTPGLSKYSNGVVRTDCICRTSVKADRKLLVVNCDKAFLQGKTEHLSASFNLSDITLETEKNDKITYLIIYSANRTELLRFPVPEHDYEVEQLMKQSRYR